MTIEVLSFGVQTYGVAYGFRACFEDELVFSVLICFFCAEDAFPVAEVFCCSCCFDCEEGICC